MVSDLGILRSAELVLDIAAAADEFRMDHPERQQLLSALLHLITLDADSVRLKIKRAGLAGVLAKPDAGTAEPTDGLFGLVVPIQLKRRGVEAKLVMPAARSRRRSWSP